LSPLTRLLILPSLAALLAGCAASLARVEPWERGRLAGDPMRAETTATEMKDWGHIYFSKEGTPANAGGGGGGCGCN
jgi:hypothetical protein